MDFLNSFAFDFFCRPIIERGGYNPVNTIVYGAVLIIAAFFIIFPMLERKGLKFDLKFVLALLPYILLGSSFRILEDLHLVGRSCNPLEWQFYTFTPGIYIATFIITMVSLAISVYAAKKLKMNFRPIFGIIGLALSIPLLWFNFTKFTEWTGFIEVLALAAVFIILTKFIVERFKKNFFENKLNLLALSGQVLDGSATFVATQFYRCGEQHFVSDAVLQFFPLGFIIIKILFVILLIHYLERDIKNKNLQNFIKMVVIILGFAPGIRDLLTIGVGTCN